MIQLIERLDGRRVRRRLLAAGGVAAVVAVGITALGGCSADGGTDPAMSTGGTNTDAGVPPATSTATADTTASPGADLPIEQGGPLVTLPECDTPPAGVEGDVAGLLLPDGAVVTEVEDLGQLVSVRAYIEQTPIQVKQFYAQEPGLELFEIEDEIYEAEVLFGGGKYRSYVKAQAQCRRGSLLLAFVGPGDSGDLPTVGGG